MNKFSNPVETSVTALQLFEPDARTVYTLDAVASLTQIPRRLIIVYCKHGLVSPVMDPACSGWYFNDEAIRILRRIEYLRTAGVFNLVGMKLVIDLLKEVEQLREELNFRRRLP
jgi:DNA-binding transcriptional MerR regulator